MWSNVKSDFPILFFDSTGTISKNIANQSDPYLYSMTFYDKKSKKYIPFFEFITTEQSQKSVSQYLTSAFFVISDYSNAVSRNRNFSGTITVTDNSTVLINSVLEVYNKCTLAQYIQWTYNILLGFKNYRKYLDLMNTIIYICSTHFFNNIRKKTKKIINDNNNLKVRKEFLVCFGLVQNSTSIEQIETYIKHIYNIFNTKFFNDSIIDSLNWIKKEVQFRNFGKYENEDFKKNKHFDKDSENINYFVKCESRNDVYKNSPFRVYFENFFKKLKTEKCKIPTTGVKMKNEMINEYYFPKLITLIEEQMYIVPLWTGLMLKVFQVKNKCMPSERFTRLSNNPVEGRFNIVKNIIFKKERKKKRRQTLSQVTSKLFFDVKATYKLYVRRRTTK
jgi:hypothetical protein